MMYYKNSDGSFSPVAPRINDAAPSNLTTYSGNKVEEIAALKLDRTDLTISEEIVLYADAWDTNSKTNNVWFVHNKNDISILVPISTNNWYQYGISLVEEQDVRFLFKCDIIPIEDIVIKIITLKCEQASDFNTKITNVNYNSEADEYNCTYTYNNNTEYETAETGAIAISSDVELSDEEINKKLDLQLDYIEAASINEPLNITNVNNKIWYIRSYIVWQIEKFRIIKYSSIIKAISNNATEIEHTGRNGNYTYNYQLSQNQDDPTKFTAIVKTTVSNLGNSTFVAGLIATRDEETANAGLTLNTSPVANVTYIKAGDIQRILSYTYTWNKSNALGQTWWVRPYVTLADGSTNTTYYGRMESFTMPNA